FSWRFYMRVRAIALGLVSLGLAYACGSSDTGFNGDNLKDASTDGNNSAGNNGTGNSNSGTGAGTGTGGGTNAGGGGAAHAAGWGNGAAGTAGTANAGGSTDGGAGDGSPGGSGGKGGPVVSPPTCHKFDDICVTGADCCSQLCDATTNKCAASVS